jgi:hypothetical protein
MNCETARHRLLEADLAELRGDGELAHHLHTCSACQDRARRILDQTAALRVTLERATPHTDAAQAARRGRITTSAPLRRWAVAVPLALAAGLTVLLIGRRREPAAPASSSPPPTVLATATPLDVQVPPGRTVTVFQTDNPNIVVIWSF